MSGYENFARFYDGLMTDAEYQKRCDYIMELAKRHNHRLGLTLDLACGTGNITCELKRRGIDVFGIDSSSEMLSEAMQKSADENLDILFLCQKMQKINLYGTINTCICTLDSINHLTRSEDVAAAFDRVGLFMDNDGLFIFDANTIYKHRKVLADNTFVFDTDIVYCVWQNAIESNNITEITLDFFEKENEVYHRTSECFKERAYGESELCEMLKAAGFEIEAVYGDLSFEKPAHNEQRVIYVARMKKSRNAEYKQ